LEGFKKKKNSRVTLPAKPHPEGVFRFRDLRDQGKTTSTPKWDPNCTIGRWVPKGGGGKSTTQSWASPKTKIFTGNFNRDERNGQRGLEGAIKAPVLEAGTEKKGFNILENSGITGEKSASFVKAKIAPIPRDRKGRPVRVFVAGFGGNREEERGKGCGKKTPGGELSKKVFFISGCLG